ncbi:MAG: ankyrin repeat domain-containing protein [Hydrogenophaga sp.]|nr:ankyrin repeat domain-containing protein [Hydrogenophaga sp.]
MNPCCRLPGNNKGPRKRGLFVAEAPSAPTRRACLSLLASGLWAASSGAHASSFEDFFRAIAADNPQTLQALANRGFDLNTRNELLEPPLVIALRLDALKVVDFLLTRPDVDVEARNAKDESPLMIAALKGRLAQCEALIKRKAHVNKTGWTPLHYAATHPGEGAPALVKLMLDHHAYIDAASPNGSTPLMLAAMYGNRQVVAQLLDAGADATLKNEQGLTALGFAHRAGRPAEADRIAQHIRGSAPKGRW